MMKVTASLHSQYRFTLDSFDSTYMSDGFKNRIVPSGDAFTFDIYDLIPGYYIQAQSYIVRLKALPPAPSTIYAPTKIEALFKLGFAVDVEYNDIMPLAKLAVGKAHQSLVSDGRLFSANHIPQMFSIIPGTDLFITSVDGDFDWKEHRFYGFLTGSRVPYGVSV
ncbi:conserved hypothetical protein [Vibrio phage 236O40-1]|nr:conserved hypothetical protein [Vibrio phage 236O40-1]